MLCNRTDATIHECWYAQGWNLSFKRHLNDWEVERVASLLKDIETFPHTYFFLKIGNVTFLSIKDMLETFKRGTQKKRIKGETSYREPNIFTRSNSSIFVCLPKK